MARNDRQSETPCPHHPVHRGSRREHLFSPLIDVNLHHQMRHESQMKVLSKWQNKEKIVKT